MAWVDPWNMVVRHFPKVPRAGFEPQTLGIEDISLFLSFFIYEVFIPETEHPREDKYQYLYPGLRSQDVTHKHITGINKPLMIMDNT